MLAEPLAAAGKAAASSGGGASVGMIHAIRRELVTILDIRPQERIRVLLLSLYFFLVITSYYVIKPVRNSLFIQRLGADNLPYVYILTALLVGLLITVYSHWADRITRRALVQRTFAFLASNLLIFWWVLNRGGLLSSGAFYIWGRIYPLLLVSQFWLVANDYFTTPQAKRVFGVIGGAESSVASLAAVSPGGSRRCSEASAFYW
jgi:AAA family ATP:ADP antiporter